MASGFERTEKDGRPPALQLLRAVRANDLPAIREAVKHTRVYSWASCEAAELGYLDALKIVYQAMETANPGENAAKKNPWSCAHAAIQNDHLHVVSWLLPHLRPLSLCGDVAEAAAKSGNLRILRAVVEWSGGHVDAAAITRCAAAAARGGHTAVLEWIIPRVKKHDIDFLLRAASCALQESCQAVVQRYQSTLQA